MYQSNKEFFRYYYTYLITGVAVLLIGAILPDLIETRNINYSVAGAFLSFFSLGHFLANFCVPYLSTKLSPKASIVLLSFMLPLGYFLIMLVPDVNILYFAFLVAGIGRGAINYVNNNVITNLAPGRSEPLNILHAFYAVGAFIAPFLASIGLGLGFTWQQLLLVTIILSCSSVVIYAQASPASLPITKAKSPGTTPATANGFPKNVSFYILSFLLFCYLGLENSINGWFITYFQSTNLMTPAYATNLVSILWVIMIVGRLVCAALAKYVPKQLLILINCSGCALFLLLLCSTQNLTLITIAMVLLGFFLAGIYPTTMANAGFLIKGSPKAMTLILTIGSLGGVILPQLVGSLADKIGMTGAISILVVDAVLMLLLALVNQFRKTNQ